MGWFVLGALAGLLLAVVIDFALFVRRGYRRKAEYEGRPS